MSAAVLGLAAAYALLGGLLLALNLRALWSWRLKALAILLTAAAAVLLFRAILDLQGWPSAAPPPPAFRVLAAEVVEPGARGGTGGAIYLWLEAEGEPSSPPRAHALPYSRPLHEALAGLLAEAGDGTELHGRLSGAQDGEPSRGERIELFLALPPPPARKDG